MTLRLELSSWTSRINKEIGCHLFCLFLSVVACGFILGIIKASNASPYYLFTLFVPITFGLWTFFAIITAKKWQKEASIITAVACLSLIFFAFFCAPYISWKTATTLIITGSIIGLFACLYYAHLS